MAELKVTIRPEQEQDYHKILSITREAFWNLYTPGAVEHLIVHKMRQTSDYVPSLSLVALVDGEIVGHIAYSLATIKSQENSETVLSFGPVSVLPSMQGKHIGSKLVTASIELAKQTNKQHRAIVILGYPSYYKRFGFENGKKYGICAVDGSFPKALQVLELYNRSLEGIKGSFMPCEAMEPSSNEVEEFEKQFEPKEKFNTPSQVVFAKMVMLQEGDEDPEDIANLANTSKL